MPRLRTARPFLEAWLRRIAREFAVSGRLSQTAAILSEEEGGTPEDWCRSLRRLVDGTETPSLKILTRIDALLAGKSPPPAGASGTRREPADQSLLFEMTKVPQDPATRTP